MKLDELNEIASQIDGSTIKASSIKDALDIIATKAKGETVKSINILDSLTTIDEYLDNIIGGDSRVAEALTITENGVTNTPAGKYYDPITVNVDIPIASHIYSAQMVKEVSSTTLNLTANASKKYYVYVRGVDTAASSELFWAFNGIPTETPESKTYELVGGSMATVTVSATISSAEVAIKLDTTEYQYGSGIEVILVEF